MNIRFSKQLIIVTVINGDSAGTLIYKGTDEEEALLAIYRSPLIMSSEWKEAEEILGTTSMDKALCW